MTLRLLILKIREIEKKKVFDHDHISKYITTEEFNR